MSGWPTWLKWLLILPALRERMNPASTSKPHRLCGYILGEAMKAEWERQEGQERWRRKAEHLRRRQSPAPPPPEAPP